jgi:hypothetical protein
VTTCRTWAVVFGCFASLCVGSCSENIQVGRDRPADSAGASGAVPNTGGAGAAAGAAGSSTTHVCQQRTCQGKVYRCGDCMDNDGDQLADSDDPDCTGPCDNTEDSYYGGIPGQNNAPCRQDCYFDQDTGSGNDQCFWSHECDPLSVAPTYPPSGDSQCAYTPNAKVPGSNSTCEGLSSVQADTCLDTCLPVTPNGCDCFGCCELPAESGKFVWIGSSAQNVGTCDAAHVDDPSACRPCTQVPSCLNACDPCEVCVGRTSPSVSCSSISARRCPPGSDACGQPGEPDCGAGFYCITGCCVAAPL